MGAKSGLALKSLQWFVRGVEFLCAALILGIFSYFLAALHNHHLHIPTSVRAVEGISGAAVLYTLIGLALLCCLAGRIFSSLIAIVLDVAFIGAFSYIAYANRKGASGCNGYVDTPFGRGQAQDTLSGNGGFTRLPSFHTACKLQTAAFAVAIIAIFFFLLSILLEFALVRHHRKEKRYGPSPKNNYTSGYGANDGAAKAGIMGRIMGRARRRGRSEKGSRSRGISENGLPAHTQPDHLDARQSYGTETTAVNAPVVGAGHGENGSHHAKKLSDPPHELQNAAPPQQQDGVDYATNNTTNNPNNDPRNYRYNDGVYDRVT